MWTYRNPYRPSEFTREYLENRGRLALYRALNIGRVVAFVGSGTSTAYGCPDWGDLVVEAAKAAKNEYQRAQRNKAQIPPSAKVLNHSLEGLMDGDKAPRDSEGKIQAMVIAENLAEQLGTLPKVKRSISEMVSKTRPTALLEKSKGAENADAALVKAGLWAAETTWEKTADPVYALAETLGVRRFLTLNYDVEIERTLQKMFRTSSHAKDLYGQPDASDFDLLCVGSDTDISGPFPHRVEYRDGSRKSVLSTTLNHQNIGELTSFSLHPGQYEAQVIHLHGRYDHPNEIVLTEPDYQRVYHRSGDQQHTFEEALSTLFDGNDVLFVGMGMEEADMLRPLRQFVSEDNSPDIARRHIYALFENTAWLDERFLTAAEVQTEDENITNFRTKHLAYKTWEDKAWSDGAIERDLKTDEARSRRLFSKYGVYTLYYGSDAFRTVRITCELLKNLCGREPAYLQSKTIAALKACDAAITALDETPLISVDEREKLQACLAAAIQHWNVKPRIGLAHADQIKSIVSWIDNEIRSRALAQELKDTKSRQNLWWQDMNQVPLPREAEYARQYIEEEKLYPLMARHRPDYKSLQHIIEEITDRKDPLFKHRYNPFELFDPLTRLKHKADKSYGENALEAALLPPSNAKNMPLRKDFGTANYEYDSNSTDMAAFQRLGLRDYSKVPPRRILRVSMERGAGKGALLHLLKQEMPKALTGEKGKPDTHSGFVLDHLFPNTRDKHGLNGDFRYHGSFVLHLSFSMEFASVIEALDLFFLQAVQGLLTDETKEDVRQSVQRRVPGDQRVGADILRFLQTELDKNPCFLDVKGDEPSVDRNIRKTVQKHFEDASQRSGPGHNHRLENLRLKMQAYTDLVDVMGDRNKRIFVAMSGIDKLCDGQGVAYNPMFRAFFRLMTGGGTKFRSESDATIPMDVLLMSGDPKTPTRYLSSEFSADQLDQQLSGPNGHTYSSYQKYRKIDDGKFLQVWAQLPRFRQHTRLWEPLNFRTQMKTYLKNLSDRDTPQCQTIRRSFSEGVAFSSWCAGGFESRLLNLGFISPVDPNEEKVQQAFVAYLTELDHATTVGGVHDVLSFVLAEHGHLFKRVHDINEPDIGSLLPIKKMVAKQSPSPTDPNYITELSELVFSHLALFPLPVEAAILEECPDIRALLNHIIVKDRNGNELTKLASREDRMAALNAMLNFLNERHLLIRINPKPIKTEKGTLSTTSSDRPERYRYIVQQQLKEYIGFQMDLHVPDAGERNYFQVSIFGDQPKDLPSPLPAHYRMVREIAQGQIRSSRHTLWCLYQLKKAKAKGDFNFKFLPTIQRGYAKDGLRLRLGHTGDAGEGLRKPAADLASFHLVSQRTRALYGMMRGGFSMGTISRLPGLDPYKSNDQPYERFGGWLRGLANAAIGLEKWADELDVIYQNKSEPAAETIRTAFMIDNTVDCADEYIENSPVPRPFYRDEIGWILNERGLLKYVQGNLYDAIPLFQQALQVMYHRGDHERNDPSLNAAVRRVELNLALARIDRGNIKAARRTLERLILPEDFSSHSGSQVSWIAGGYLALIDHISGNLDTVGPTYEQVIEQANGKRMLRLSAIFNRHLADLYRNQGKFEAARERIKSSIAEARQSEQRDVLNFSLLGKAQIEINDPNSTSKEQSKLVSSVLTFSQKMGLPRLECEALRTHAELVMMQGERILAGNIAAKSAAIANRQGLRLLKLSALRVYGEALTRRQQFDFAKSILDETRRESERRGYQSQTGRLTQALEQLPV